MLLAEVGTTMLVRETGQHCLSQRPEGRSVSAVLCKSPEKDWDVNTKMKVWGLGEWPVLLPYDGDSEDDLSDE